MYIVKVVSCEMDNRLLCIEYDGHVMFHMNIVECCGCTHECQYEREHTIEAWKRHGEECVLNICLTLTHRSL